MNIESEGKDPRVIAVSDMEMIYIPPGKFLMGSDEGRDDEKPPHEVYLEGFYVARHPVTNAQYNQFVAAEGHRQPFHWKGGTYPKAKADHPVVYVSWHSAMAYCRWLSDKTGHAVRLPTEAEWEKAARGTDGRRYPWGDEFDESKCNTKESYIGDTTPVGKYSPGGDSPYGVADMAANVSEWCSTRWGRRSGKPDYPYPYEEDEREDLEGDHLRVLHGGHFTGSRSYARCARRSGYLSPSADIGFRVVISSNSPE